MIASSLLPTRFRGEQLPSKPGPPSWLSSKLTPLLQLLSKVTSTHPIHTIVIVAVLASTTYLGLLKESLLDVSPVVRTADWMSMTEGSRSLRAGPDNGWKWQTTDAESMITPGGEHLALITLVFPESLSENAPKTAPVLQTIPKPENLSVTFLPSTSNTLATYSQDTSMAFAVPYKQAPDFLAVSQELPDGPTSGEGRDATKEEKKMWIMKAAKGNTRRSLVQWVTNAWFDFIDLLKNASTFDIVLMVLGYLSMHLTFVTLFLSMRQLGSNFWLATSVLFNSVFAFMFALIVTTKLGVPISVVLLSEGLPFLVVTIGFEKSVTLTEAVLNHSIEHKRRLEKTAKKGRRTSDSAAGTIQAAIQLAIKEQGYHALKHYALEIGILSTLVATGVSGGMRNFCILAIWILFFDCVLMFTFYTAILCIKLEITRIKRHVEVRRYLEDDGISHRVAENVATNDDQKNASGISILGFNVKSTSVPKFKVLMVSGFVLINLVNICTIPFRSTNSLGNLSTWVGGISGIVNTPAVDPYKVASNGLDMILSQAQTDSQEVMVTILTPIKYVLEYPSIHYAEHLSTNATDADYGVGGRMVGSILKSFEDPVLSKWIIIALALSVSFNGYLFNAARWGIKDPNLPDQPIDRRELDRAQRFNDSESVPGTPFGLPRERGRQHNLLPLTPAGTDDDSDAATLVRYPSAISLVDRGTQRSLAELEKMLEEKRIPEMTDEEVVTLALKGMIPGHQLERSLKDCVRAVKVRRTVVSRTKATSDLTNKLETSKLPYEDYNWAQVLGACCENVIGFMPLPVGVAGPLVVDGRSYFLPMATTEGVLVASTSRGCKAINSGGGAVTVLTADGMTRGPCVSFETLERAGTAKHWLDSEEGQAAMKNAFNSTSNYAKLESMRTAMAGTNLYIRFKARTGDAMGMNMISKGVEKALDVMRKEGNFLDMNIVSLSGNYCIDKKPGAINWIEGRGKSVVAEAIIPGHVVRTVLKADVDLMVQLNTDKNLIGSAMAGSIGGFNAHAANIVAAMFIATGQDPAQVVESANCMTIMKNLKGDLQISVTMPSIEVGTLGGGTILEPQSAMLDLLGVRGAHAVTPGENARRLARIIAAATLAGELSLCSALAAGHLVKAHMAHNRSAPPTRSSTPAPPPLTLGAGLSAASTMVGSLSPGLGGNGSGNGSGSGSGAVTPVGLTMTSAGDRNGLLSAAANDRRAKR